jgi:AcrR family transcriptional regulator
VRETRAKILAAAGEALLNTDYNAITLDAIGESAGIILQTIIRHFVSKERLFRVW